MRRLVYGESERVGKWMEGQGAAYYRDGSQCIGLEIDGDLVAGVLYDYDNGASVFCHIAISDKRALGRDFLFAVFDYPFNQLGCRVLVGLVAEDNTDAQRFDEHLGFTLEHRIKDADPSGDLLVYEMRRPECRWLSLGEVNDGQAKGP